MVSLQTCGRKTHRQRAGFEVTTRKHNSVGLAALTKPAAVPPPFIKPNLPSPVRFAGVFSSLVAGISCRGARCFVLYFLITSERFLQALATSFFGRLVLNS